MRAARGCWRYTSGERKSTALQQLDCAAHTKRAGQPFQVENRRFNLPHLSLVPPLGVTPLEFRRDLWHHKTRI